MNEPTAELGSASPALEIDARGLKCPLPVIMLARRLPEIEIGQIVEVATEDRAAATDVPAFCRMRGHSFLGERVAADGVPLYQVRREV